MSRLKPYLTGWLGGAVFILAMTVTLLLSGCGGGEPEPEQVPTWCNWMGPPASNCTAPDTRLIEPPRDSRVL